MNNSVSIDHEQASKLVSKLLVESWIVAISYWRAGWDITLAVEEDHWAVEAGLLGHPFELVLSANELTVAEPELWSQCIAAAPLDIAAQSDRHDALAALLLFNSIAYRVAASRATADGDLLLVFEGNRALVIHGHVRGTEDEWSIANKWPAQKDDQTVFVGADAGTLYAFPQLQIALSSVP